jgi:hypothetical protein
MKGAGAVYSRAISECVSDADLSTGKFPAYPVIRSQRQVRRRDVGWAGSTGGVSGVSAGFGAGRESRCATVSHLSRWVFISSYIERRSAKRCSARSARARSSASVAAYSLGTVSDRNRCPFTSRYRANSEPSIAHEPSSRRVADSLPLAIALLIVSWKRLAAELPRRGSTWCP